jgi:hypothetical protein
MGFVTKPNPCTMQIYPDDSSIRPAPVVMNLVVCRESVNRVACLRAFLDTGADCTLLAPRGLRMLEQCLGPLLSEGLLPWHDKNVPAYQLSFSFDGEEHWFTPDSAVRYAETDYPGDECTEDILIGRDLLWQFEFCCDGPSGNFSLKHPKHC